ncbi:MAG TPA: HD domain-containing protein, partial [Anaerolineae bacterium]|nr:HD domain-containing protein [Anaerolineae bacterium]
RSVDSELVEVARKYPYLKGTKTEVMQSLFAYREVLNKNHDRIKATHNNHGSGIVVCSLLSKLIDILIIHISNVLNLCKNGEDGFAVVALGGYGRNELNPYSDIDLLFLFEENIERVYEKNIRAMIQFLWDMNLDIGHSTRTLTECIEAAENDTYLATSLLEARFLTGNKAIWKEFKDLYNSWLRDGAGRNLAMQKIEERNARLKSYHGTVQIQVPNVKESPGGLRDIHTSRWLMMLTEHGNSLWDIYNSGFLYEYEMQAYEEDFDFLLRVRNAMHFIAGKKSDLLAHLSLPEIAKNLKYSGSRTKYTEKFMREYYMRAGRVYRLSGHIIGRLLRSFKTSTPHTLKSDESGLRIIDGKAGFPPDIENSLQEHPEMIVKVFALAAAQKIEITENTTSIIEKNIHKLNEKFPENPQVRTAFQELINSGKGPGKAFRLMHEHGVLTKLIPEFGTISWHFQYNFYHAYTTDEHSIRVVENLEKMALGTVSSMPELSDIMADVTARGALYLTGILHDIGKGKGKDHALRGERMAARALVRLGFDERTIELVRFLIREHLLMAHISQRRDMEDEDTIRDIVKRAGSTGRLRMLTLLTFADLMALSNEALTDWKKALLMSLYNKTMMYLDKGYEKLSTQSGEYIINRILSSRRDTLPEQVIRNHIELLPEQYIRVTS